MKLKKINNKFTNEQLMLFLFSLIIAILLWSYVISEVDPVRATVVRDIKIKYKNVVSLRQNKITILDPKEATVTVSLQGKKSVMDKFKEDTVIASIDLLGYSQGSHTVPVRVEVNTPGVEVENIEPRNLNFVLDEDIKVTKELTYETEGMLADGYLAGKIELSRYKIEVEGPKSYVEKIEKLGVIIDIDGRTETTVISAPIIAYDGEGNVVNGISIKPDTADAQIPIYKTVTVPIKLNIVGTLPNDLNIKNLAVQPSSVTLSGDSSIVNSVVDVKTKAVNINDIVNGRVKNATLIEPEGTKIINPDQIFKITYDSNLSATKNFEVPITELKGENLKDGLSFQPSNSNILVKVSITGPSKLIEALKSDNVALAADLSNLTKGRHRVNLIVKEIDGVKINLIEPKAVEIQVK